jgi:hypothetical protein
MTSLEGKMQPFQTAMLSLVNEDSECHSSEIPYATKAREFHHSE